MFDPWSDSLEDALEENRRLNSKFPLMQFITARGISKARPSIEGKIGGDVGLAIMCCIATCARRGLVIPAWLSDEFCKRVDVVSMGRQVSWDDSSVLGKPYKKGTHKDAEWNRADRSMQAWLIAKQIKDAEPATPVDAGFFERIGEAMNPKFRKTEAEEAYYRAKKMMGDSESMTLDDIIADLTTPGAFE